MGAWGTAIFSDDFACDVRDDYVKEIIRGKTSEEATEIIKKKHFPTKPDDEEITVFWISLAVIQWKKGRLLPDVKKEAILAIESGADLIRWKSESKKILGKRKDALEKAKQMLLSPMPPAKKIPMPSWMKDDPWQLGDLISYKIVSGDIDYPEYIGKYVILKVVEVRPIQLGGPKNNFYAVYSWCGDKIPDELTAIKNKGYLKFSESEGGRYVTRKKFSASMRDIKEHDMKLLENDVGFNVENDEFLKNGIWDGRFHPTLDYLLSRQLHAETLKAKEQSH